MRHAGSAMFIDQRAGGEAIERERRGNFVRLTLRDSVSEDKSRAWDRLEAAGTPATIEIKPRYRRLADNGARIRADINDATPLAHHLDATEYWKQFNRGGQHVFFILLSHQSALAPRESLAFFFSARIISITVL